MAAGPGSGPGAPSEAEAAHLCRSLEVGTVMTLFYSKKSQRPERKTFQVKLETRQVTWSRGSEKIEGAVDIREIKEIRPGKNSRDFDRYQEDPCFRLDQSHCFVVLYGTEFRLKTLSLQATSEDEVNMWIKGLNWLVADTLRAPTPLQIERWLRKQFYSLDRNREDRCLDPATSLDPIAVKHLHPQLPSPEEADTSEPTSSCGRPVRAELGCVCYSPPCLVYSSALRSIQEDCWIIPLLGL